MRKQSNVLGFTLIEITVVVVIFILLSSFVIINVIFSIQKVRDKRRKSDLAQIKAALEMYRSVNKSYPVSLYTTSCPASSALTDGTIVYMQKIPCDPTTKSDYSYTPSPAGCGSGLCTSYSLYTCLDDSNDTEKDATTKTAPVVDCTVSPFNASYTIVEQ